MCKVFRSCFVFGRSGADVARQLFGTSLLGCRVTRRLRELSSGAIEQGEQVSGVDTVRLSNFCAWLVSRWISESEDCQHNRAWSRFWVPCNGGLGRGCGHSAFLKWEQLLFW